MRRERGCVSGRKLMKPGSELNRTAVLVLYWGLNLERRPSLDKSEERFADFGAERGGGRRPLRAGGVRIS